MCGHGMIERGQTSPSLSMAISSTLSIDFQNCVYVHSFGWVHLGNACTSTKHLLVPTPITLYKQPHEG